jgi:hypothetical protein
LIVVECFEVDVDWASVGERVVRPDGVEELPVALDVEAQVVAVVNLVPVEVLVLERAEGALTDAVLAGRLPLGADVDQLGVLVDEGREARRLEAGPGRSVPPTDSAAKSARVW